MTFSKSYLGIFWPQYLTFGYGIYFTFIHIFFLFESFFEHF